MKMYKKITLSVVGVIAMLVFAIGSANAAVTCTNGTVVKTGVLPDFENATKSKYTATINCTAGWTGTTTFYLTTLLGDAGYATALTAMSTGQPVEVKSYNTVDNSLMLWIHLLPTP